MLSALLITMWLKCWRCYIWHGAADMSLVLLWFFKKVILGMWGTIRVFWLWLGSAAVPRAQQVFTRLLGWGFRNFVAFLVLADGEVLKFSGSSRPAAWEERLAGDSQLLFLCNCDSRTGAKTKPKYYSRWQRVKWRRPERIRVCLGSKKGGSDVYRPEGRKKRHRLVQWSQSLNFLRKSWF